MKFSRVLGSLMIAGTIALSGCVVYQPAPATAADQTYASNPVEYGQGYRRQQYNNNVINARRRCPYHMTTPCPRACVNSPQYSQYKIEQLESEIRDLKTQVNKKR